MKKLMAISVMFALIVSGAFAIDISGAVIGTVNVLEGSTAKNLAGDTADLEATGSLSRARLEVSGETDSGTFGGWIRYDILDIGVPGVPFLTGLSGNAWWSPIKQFKLIIGGSGGDGFFAKDGVAAYGFYLGAGDAGAANPNLAWGPSDAYYDFGLMYLNAFYGGFGGYGAMLSINPIDMIGVNIAIPFIPGGAAADVYKSITAQLDLNFDFGNIAVTFQGASNTYDIAEQEADASSIFAYFGLTAINNIGLDVGFSYTLPVKASNATYDYTYNSPIAAGLGLEVTVGDFGIKFRAVASFGGSIVRRTIATNTSLTNDMPFTMLLDVLPSFAINDSLSVFFSAGIGFSGEFTERQSGFNVIYPSAFGWHINPYIEFSAGGASFFAGFKLWSDGSGDAYNGSKFINFAIPIGITVGF
ncbi:MAG: hypothetical protein FWD26_07780 [Treponema sp.]|nr:hypothetical protein [Treponema sp.]